MKKTRQALLVLLCLFFAPWGLFAGEPSGPAPAPPVEDASEAASTSPEHRSRPTPLELKRAVDRAVGFLLAVQNPDGSWGSARRTKRLNIYAPVPGAHQAFRAGTTALCLAALIETGPEAGRTRQAIERGEAWILEELPRLRRATGDAMYNVWGHAYGIQALVRMLRRHSGDEGMKKRIEDAIRGQFDLLGRYETLAGGWAYYDFEAQTQKPSGSTIGFVSATVLVAFHEARQAGVEPPPALVRRAIDSIHRQMKPDFSYLYGEYLWWRPERLINRPGGSLGRSQACNVALRMWGDARVTDAVLETWLRKLHDRNPWLDFGRKRPIPHESWFQVAGYFFYYGHYYAARCIEELEPARRQPFQDQLAGILLALQEKDGSFWDYPLYDYHQQYGTAFALMTLVRCRPTRGY